MDQGMTAAVGPYFNNMEQRFRGDVPPITVHRVPATIAAFIDDLFTDSSVTKPVGDVYVATHAGGDGFLFVRLFRGQLNVLGDPTDVTDFEVLDQAMKPARPGKIPDSLVGYVRATPPATDPAPTHSVHIKGCNIGRDRFIPGAGKPLAPFLVKLKEVFGGNVKVTAPKHFHGLLPETNHNGMFEYMAQELIVRTKAEKIKKGYRGFKNRDDLIKAYKAAKLSYHDNTPIPDPDWDTILVPKRMVEDRGISQSFPLAQTIEHLTKVKIHKEFRIEPEHVDWTLSGAAATPDTDRLTKLRASIAADDRFKPAHPWPMYERRGFKDFSSYMEGHLWEFAVDGDDLACTGRRFDYTVVLPIVDRTVNPPADRPLIFNFYPGAGSPDPAVLTGLLESDDHFFGRA